MYKRDYKTVSDFYMGSEYAIYISMRDHVRQAI